MRNPASMERPELMAEVTQLRERAARTVPVIEAAVSLRVANRRRGDEAEVERATAELLDAVDELIVGTVAHATAVKLGLTQ
jgi:hypothetical protein